MILIVLKMLHLTICCLSYDATAKPIALLHIVLVDDMDSFALLRAENAKGRAVSILSEMVMMK